MGELLAALRADPAEARRRRLRVAVSVLSVLALIGAMVAGWQAYRGWTAARLAQQFGQEAAQVSAIGRYAALLPLHDTRRETDAIRARMEGLKQRMTTLGRLAAGPGHYALGRGYMTLEKIDDALRELETAWAAGYRGPELAYALGLVHGQLYQRALADLRKTKDAALDARRRDEIARAHRDPALRYLKLAAAEESRGHPLAGVEAPEYVEGLIALYEQHWDEALALARRAGDRVSWLYEAGELEGDVHFLRGKELFNKGDVDGALAEYRRAGDAYRAVSAVARSSAAAWMGDCRELIEIESVEVERDRSPAETQKRALAACASAATARPDLAEPVAAEAKTWSQLANYQKTHGQDPTAAEEAAIKLGEQALAIDPREARAHHALGIAELDLAEFRAGKDQDPNSLFNQAIEQARQALELDAGYVEAYSLLMHTHLTRARFEAGRGADPRQALRTAGTYGQEATRLSPGDFGLWDGLGLVETDQGEYERDHGGDPGPAFGRAEEAFERVARLSPTLDYGAANLCWLHAEWAQYEMRRGTDLQRRIEVTLKWCQTAMGLDRDDAVSYFHLGRTYLYQATLQVEQRKDPTDLIAKARVAKDRAVEIDRENWNVQTTLGPVLEARWLEVLGRDPQPAFARAEELGKAEVKRTEGKDADALLELAEVHRRRAEWRQGRKQSIDADVREGLALVTSAFAAKSDHANASETEGALQLIAARAASGPTRNETAGKARTAFEKALAINGNLEHEIRPMLDEATRLAQ
jgi:serine/threonine-protein kinase